MKSAQSSRVKSGRLGRLGQMGRLATGLAGGVVSEGARQFAQGKRPQWRELMLTPGNLGRVADQLAQLRGAAMKVGQLLSMDTGQLLPPELSGLLDRLRSEGYAMPTRQLREVLVREWGPDWQARFNDFDLRPIASASIGQVHKALTHDGRWLAVKVQYPGIVNSIDSDVDNVASLLRLSGLLPKALDLTPLLAEAKAQLHAETDYQREAEAMSRYQALVGASSDLAVPGVEAEYSTARVLAMQYMPGQPVDQLGAYTQATRNHVVSRLFDLLFHELFEFQWVQTDPNFANFLYDHESQRMTLLDFGAMRAYPDAVVAGYRDLLRACVAGDEDAMFQAAQTIGYFDQSVTEEQKQTVLSLFYIATEPLRHEGAYAFGASDLATRIREKGLALSFEQEYWHTPPVDALFLHRKLAGVYLLAHRLDVHLDMSGWVEQWLR